MEQAEEEIKEVLEKNNVKLGYNIRFPIYSILPDEVQLALRVLQKNGMKIEVIIIEQEDKKE